MYPESIITYHHLYTIKSKLTCKLMYVLIRLGYQYMYIHTSEFPSVIFFHCELLTYPRLFSRLYGTNVKLNLPNKFSLSLLLHNNYKKVSKSFYPEIIVLENLRGKIEKNSRVARIFKFITKTKTKRLSLPGMFRGSS